MRALVGSVRSLVLLAALAAPVALSGCTGSSDDAGTTTTEVTATFCSVFDEYKVEISGVGVGAEPAEQEAAFTKVAPALDQLDQLAPEEIRADTKIVTDHLRAYSDLLEQFDWSYEKISTEGTEDYTSILAPDEANVAAYRRLTEYIRANCPGVVVPGPSVPTVSMPDVTVPATSVPG